MKLASVILDIPTQALDAPYTYLVPEEMESGDFDICVGCAVIVPLGGRKAVGYVVGMREFTPDALPDGMSAEKLKYIERAVSSSYFDEEGAACAQWLAERYIAPLSACVRLLTPPGGVPRMVRAPEGYWRLEQPAIGEVDDRWVTLGPAAADFEPRKNAFKQQRIINALKGGDLRAAELALEFGSVSSTIKGRRIRSFGETAANRWAKPSATSHLPGVRRQARRSRARRRRDRVGQDRGLPASHRIRARTG